MCPGAGPAAWTTAAVARATVAGSVSRTTGSRFPCSATRAPSSRRARQCRRSSRARPPRRRYPRARPAIARRFGEDDGRHLAAVRTRLQRRQHARHRRQRERAVGGRGQHSAPGVEHHHRIGPVGDLLVEVRRHRPRIDVDQALQQIGAGAGHLAHGGEVRAAGAFDHVAGEREGAAGEAEQRHAAAERPLDLGDGVEHIAQLRHVGDIQRPIAASSPVVRANRGPSPAAKSNPSPMASGTVRMSENRIAASSAKRASGCSVTSVASAGDCASAMKLPPAPASRCTRQVTAGLAHQPDGRIGVGSRLSARSSVSLREWHSGCAGARRGDPRPLRREIYAARASARPVRRSRIASGERAGS